MKTEFKDSFLKDIRSIKDKKLLSRLEQFILTVESLDDLSQIPNLKKLKGQKNKVYYRSRIGNYRVGLIIKQDIVVFVRFLARKKVYRYFP
ncbi:Plasmid stabilization system protein [Xenococcus sp. PCC 7305]|uniref:type II toxin-antitoxin system RelE family toxin n=1 Tax=Xenococcus sp. PCC 7305 TaxID=102125 RepID=UPI0002ABD3D5|nr:type II toxin-antitoxin system RelE/ParE family toxin [Xenococcus sp. PCC 7305]ELS04544.1 Plasmid stabilization system protein [Xenococcus sp. PCC 7305]